LLSYSSAVTIYLIPSALINPVQAQLIYCFVILVAIHFLFNWKIDYWNLYERFQNHSDSTKHSGIGVYPFDIPDYELAEFEILEGTSPAALAEISPPVLTKIKSSNNHDDEDGGVGGVGGGINNHSRNHSVTNSVDLIHSVQQRLSEIKVANGPQPVADAKAMGFI
jgi:hypothetical protein